MRAVCAAVPKRFNFMIGIKRKFFTSPSSRPPASSGSASA